MEKKPRRLPNPKKLTGFDVYICIDIHQYPDQLTINKPYRVQYCMFYMDDIYYYIKADNGEMIYVPHKCFRKRK